MAMGMSMGSGSDKNKDTLMKAQAQRKKNGRIKSKEELNWKVKKIWYTARYPLIFVFIISIVWKWEYFPSLFHDKLRYFTHFSPHYAMG